MASQTFWFWVTAVELIPVAIVVIYAFIQGGC